MSYDFSFMIVTPRPEAFPFWLHPEFSGNIAPLRDPEAVRQALLDRAGFRLNGPAIAGTQWYQWESADEGILDVRVYEDSVPVDTHASWNCVLRLYQVLVALEPDLLIVDNQTALLYHAASYQQFIDESYARKTGA